MRNITGIAAYTFLMEMEAQRHKINEMIMAPKFAKLLNENVDEDDFRIHNSKTNELTSEFVNTAFKNTVSVINLVIEHLENIRINQRLVIACENKMKSLTLEDKEGFLLEKADMNKTVSDFKDEIFKGIDTVTNGFTKLLESPCETKEEYAETINSFRGLVSGCSSKLRQQETPQGTDVTTSEVPSIINRYKFSNSVVDDNVSVLHDAKKCLERCKESIKPETCVKVKESVYLTTGYLVKAVSVLESLIVESNTNTVNILCEFISNETSKDSMSLYEFSMSNIIGESLEDEEDFIK